MKLFWSGTSPYVRKVMACAIAREIDLQIATVACNPWTSPAELIAANPLCKVPCLVTIDGVALFDSPVICAFLDSVGDAPAMLPAAGAARWRALKQQALGDGMLDAAVARRQEQGRPREAARDAQMVRFKAAVEQALDALEAELPERPLDIGTLTLGCALGYLDFRFAGEPWRPRRPRLADWFAAMSEAPALARTVPRDPA